MNLRIAFVVLGSLLAVIFLNSCASHVELCNGEDLQGWAIYLDTSEEVGEVWSVEDGVIHCKGFPTGYIRTDSEYGDYILTLEWRWVEKGGNSGVLLHAQAPDQVWPNCVECQLKSESAGDFVLIGPGSITVDQKPYENTERFMIIPHKTDGVEKPIGQWNQYNIFCRGDRIDCFVNGVLQNVGKKASLSRGHICLQSEGTPIEFRNIRLYPMK